MGGVMHWLGDTLETARQTALLQLHARIVQLLGLGCLVFPFGFWMVAQRAAEHVEGDDFFAVVCYMAVFQFGLPATCLYLGVAAVHGDLQDRTATYLFVRPIRRSSLLVGKCMAVIALCWAGAALAMTLLFAALAWLPLSWRFGIRPTPAMLGSLCVAAGLTAIGLTALVACFAALFRRPLVVGAVFIVGWEVIVNLAPPNAGVRDFSVLDPVRRWLLERLPSAGDLADLPQMNGDHRWLGPGVLEDPLVVLARFTTAAMAVALWVYTRREYDSRPTE